MRETLTRLRDAGMDSLPGGGAEIFNERVRRIICDHKIDGNEWLETARMAHELGLRSNCTMLYGHIENEEDRADHLVRLRALQDETHGFVTFIPLAFHPDNTALHHIPKTTGFDDIKNIAVARLMLDNIPHIKAYWVMMTPRIAQIALRFGADDIDGTIVEERIYHDAGATTTPELAPRRLAAVDPPRGTHAGGARYAVSACGTQRIGVYRTGIDSRRALRTRQAWRLPYNLWDFVRGGESSRCSPGLLRPPSLQSLTLLSRWEHCRRQLLSTWAYRREPRDFIR